jgi:hypothetical protein
MFGITINNTSFFKALSLIWVEIMKKSHEDIIHDSRYWNVSEEKVSIF